MFIMQQLLRQMRLLRVVLRTRQWIKLLLFVGLFVLFGTVGFYLTESPAKPELTLLDGLWWAIVTMTTVGYGDLYPESPIGRFFVAFPAMIAGGGVIAYTISIVATYLIEVKNREMRGMNKLELSDHMVFVNFPGALKVADMVQEIQADTTTGDMPIVLLTGSIEEIPESLAVLGIHFVKGSPINEEALSKACVKSAKYCVVFAQDERDENCDSYNLGVLVGLRATGSKANVVAECVSPQHRTLMRKAGADAVICVGELSIMLLAQASQGEPIQDLIEDLASNRTPQQIDYVRFAKRSESVTFADAAEKLAAEGTILIGVRRADWHELNPAQTFPLEDGDRLVIISAQRPQEFSC